MTSYNCVGEGAAKFLEGQNGGSNDRLGSKFHFTTNGAASACQIYLPHVLGFSDRSSGTRLTRLRAPGCCFTRALRASSSLDNTNHSSQLLSEHFTMHELLNNRLSNHAVHTTGELFS